MRVRQVTLRFRRLQIVAVLAGAALLLGGSHAWAAPAATERINYNRDVRPILSDNCFYCHGPDKNHRDGKFRLDERESAVGKGAIVPASRRERDDRPHLHDDEGDLMPPPRRTRR
jgi:hypothetical protein